MSPEGGFDRGRVPSPGAIRPFDFPEVHAFDLGNGLKVRVARLAGLPVVTSSLVLEAGESGLPDERAGLGVLTGDALDAGTRGRSGAELAEALEGLGVSLGVSTGWDVTTVSLSCLTERWEEAATLGAEVVGSPSFEAAEFERSKRQRLASIEQRRMDPRSLADDSAARFVFADGVPYARPLAGTRESVEGLGREDARAFAAEHYAPGHGGLVVVGDVDPDSVARVAQELFGAAPNDAPQRIPVPIHPRSMERTVHVVHRPDAVQSEIRIGQVGQPRSTPDFFALSVLNTVLGGAFTSRLNLNLRERHGFTYGVRSRFAFRRHAGPFTVSTAVATDVTAAAVREAVSELESIVAEGPTAAEVRAARDYIVGVFPLRLQTTGQIASRLCDLLIHDLKDDYYATYRERVAAVSTEDATGAGQRALRPSAMTVVVVGDAEQVQAPLEELGVGDVRVHDTSGAE